MGTKRDPSVDKAWKFGGLYVKQREMQWGIWRTCLHWNGVGKGSLTVRLIRSERERERERAKEMRA